MKNTNFVVRPIRMDTTPHRPIHKGRKIEGFPTRAKNIFLE